MIDIAELERDGYLRPGWRDRIKAQPSSIKTDEEKAADEMLLLWLLAGYRVNESGVEVADFRMSVQEERQARKVLAQRLRHGTLGSLTRELLALAVDPTTPSEHPDLRPTRKIVFQRPDKGGSLTWARDRAIIYEIKKRRRQGDSDEDAVNGAADYYGLQRSRTWEIWTAWKKAALENPSDQKATSTG